MKLRDIMLDIVFWFIVSVIPLVISIFAGVNQLGLIWIFTIIVYSLIARRRENKLSKMALYIILLVSIAIYLTSKYLNIYYGIDAYALFIIFPALLGVLVGTTEMRYIKQAFIIESLLQLLVLTDKNLLYNGLKPVFIQLELAILLSYVVLVVSALLGRIVSRIA